MADIVIAIVVVVVAPPIVSAPIFPDRMLPTELRPRIVLHGDKRMDLADPRIEDMTVAPVLHDAIRVLLRLLVVSVSFLAVGSRAKKTEDAKRTEY